MSIEDLMISGYCDDCDMDPAKCWLCGVCAYEEENNDEC